MSKRNTVLNEWNYANVQCEQRACKLSVAVFRPLALTRVTGARFMSTFPSAHSLSCNYMTAIRIEEILTP